MRTQEFWNLLIFEVPGADSGVRVSRNGQKKNRGRRKLNLPLTFLRPLQFFSRSDLPSPHYLPLGLRGWIGICFEKTEQKTHSKVLVLTPD